MRTLSRRPIMITYPFPSAFLSLPLLRTVSSPYVTASTNLVQGPKVTQRPILYVATDRHIGRCRCKNRPRSTGLHVALSPSSRPVDQSVGETRPPDQSVTSRQRASRHSNRQPRSQLLVRALVNSSKYSSPRPRFRLVALPELVRTETVTVHGRSRMGRYG